MLLLVYEYTNYPIKGYLTNPVTRIPTRQSRQIRSQPIYICSQSHYSRCQRYGISQNHSRRILVLPFTSNVSTIYLCPKRKNQKPTSPSPKNYLSCVLPMKNAIYSRLFRFRLSRLVPHSKKNSRSASVKTFPRTPRTSPSPAPTTLWLMPW